MGSWPQQPQNRWGTVSIKRQDGGAVEINGPAADDVFPVTTTGESEVEEMVSQTVFRPPRLRIY